MAGLHSEGPSPLQLPIIGKLNRLSRPAILGIALGVGLLVAVLLSGALALAGAVL